MHMLVLLITLPLLHSVQPVPWSQNCRPLYVQAFAALALSDSVPRRPWLSVVLIAVVQQYHIIYECP